MAFSRSIPGHILSTSVPTRGSTSSIPARFATATTSHSISTFARKPLTPPYTTTVSASTRLSRNSLASSFPAPCPHSSRRLLTTAQTYRFPSPPSSPHSSSPKRIVDRSDNTSTTRRPPPPPPPGGHPRFRSRPPNTPATPFSASKLATKDRGPTSKEETQTDFSKLNVLGNTVAPATSVDICAWDGFVLDSGLRVGDGDGVLLVGADAFLWRPWMGGAGGVAGGNEDGGARGLIHGSMLKRGSSETERTGGVVNRKGQFEVADEVWGLFKTLWPKPDILIIGTGPTIRPLAPPTRQYLQTLGLRIEVLDTRNAASQFNMLATERGVQEIAAALVPIGFGAKE